MADDHSPIDVYYDMDIAQICAHFGKSRNTVDKAVAKLVRNYPDAGWKYKNPKTRRITIKADGVEVLSTYFRKEKHEVSAVESELRMEIEKLNAILDEKDKTIANLEMLYQERLKLEMDKARQTYLLEQKSNEDTISEQKTMLDDQAKLIEEHETKISDLESENQKLQETKSKTEEAERQLKSEMEDLRKSKEELEKTKEDYRKKEEEYNSKSFFYRLIHKFSLK